MAIESCPLQHGYGMMGFGYGWIFQTLIFIVFFLVVWWLIKSAPSNTRNKETKEKPVEILKRRLAQGEITKKEYETLKKEVEN